MRRQEAEGRRQKAGGRRQKAGGRRQKAGGRMHQPTPNPSLEENRKSRGKEICTVSFSQ
ncbi:MAG: hypothetical protein F6J96_23875 [Symploca sp. SIO1C2]|nr:hypothetical protein [Symploca sp. SIO1C2]